MYPPPTVKCGEESSSCYTLPTAHAESNEPLFPRGHGAGLLQRLTPGWDSTSTSASPSHLIATVEMLVRAGRIVTVNDCRNPSSKRYLLPPLGIINRESRGPRPVECRIQPMETWLPLGKSGRSIARPSKAFDAKPLLEPLHLRCKRFGSPQCGDVVRPTG